MKASFRWVALCSVCGSIILAAWIFSRPHYQYETLGNAPYQRVVQINERTGESRVVYSAFSLLPTSTETDEGKWWEEAPVAQK